MEDFFSFFFFFWFSYYVVCFPTYSRKKRGFQVGLLEPLSSLESHGNIAQASNTPIPQTVLACCWIPNAPLCVDEGRVAEGGPAEPAGGALAEFGPVGVGPGPAGGVGPAVSSGPWNAVRADVGLALDRNVGSPWPIVRAPSCLW
jgi:hypothetical protein